MMEEVDLADTPLAMRPQLQCQESLTGSDEEPPDPRIQVELERLNTSTDLINKLEVDLDEARMMFRQTLLESTQQIDNLTKKLGKCVEQARPYYEARIKAKQALTEAQKSAVRYERAVSQHAAAREMVQLAEEGLLTRGCIFDSTWQEMLNHATTKVNDAEREKIESTAEHKDKSNIYHESETRVKVLQKELKRCIAKSSLNARRSLLQLTHIIRMQELQLLPYFELKAAVNQRLEEQKKHVRELESAVAAAKSNYAQALTNLETISDQIHKTRQSRLDLGIRGVGVGAESPGPPFCTRSEKEIAQEKNSAIERTKRESLEKSAAKDEDFLKMGKLENLTPIERPCEKVSTAPLEGAEGKNKVEVAATKVSFPEEGCRSEKEETKDSTSCVEVPLKCSVEELKSVNCCSSGPLREEEPSLSQARPSYPKSNEGGAATSDSGEQQGSFLSGWQFVAIPNAVPTVTNQNLLAVDDKESIVSDSESLTSMEMLSEEVIANLMLEDEINEASQSIFADEFLAPPSSSSVGAAALGTGTLEKASSRGGDDEEVDKHKSKNQPCSSEESSGGDPWEVVSEAPPSTAASITPSTITPGRPDHNCGGVGGKGPEVESHVDDSTQAYGEGNRPQSLALVQPQPPRKGHLKNGASSMSSSSSSSASSSFSPSYAPLSSETPEVDRPEAVPPPNQTPLDFPTQQHPPLIHHR